jgi:hypothetical protein
VRPQFLSFLDVSKTMARVWRRRNLGSAAKKRRKGGESGQLLNIFVVFLCKGLIQETRSWRGCNALTSNCSAQLNWRGDDRCDRSER